MRIIGNAGTAPRKVQAVASGALATGDTVVVNADGTVSVVGSTAVSQAIGSAVVFESSTVRHTAATFDSNSNRVVIAYIDQGDSNDGTAIVGTVNPSNNSISYGTAVKFDTGASDSFMCATFDSNSNRVIISYRNASTYGAAIVGTVDPSDNSISFGTSVVYESANSYYQQSTFDTNSNKVVIAYRDAGNSNYGNAVVGTVDPSNNSISFGSVVVFNQGTTTEISCAFDSSNNRVVIAYKDNSNSNRGTAIVGNVSNTSISFGSEVVFDSSATEWTSTVFDSSNNKIVIAFLRGYGRAIVGTVDPSDNSISFGTAAVFESYSVSYISASFDSNTNTVVVAYQDAETYDGTLSVGTISGTDISFTTPLVFDTDVSDFTRTTCDSNSKKIVVGYKAGEGNTGPGTSFVFQPPGSIPNLTAENYIGIASNGYATGQAATINVKGFIDDNQSSLTAGQSYYVQTNGDLGLTAADPSVFAGTAVSATKLIVKG